MASIDLRAAAQQVLEALEDMLGWQSLAPQTIQEAAKGRAAALRAELAEPVQEPFALPCPTPKACRAHCCSGQCIPRAALAEPVQDTRVCTCHPDDNPPKPCPKKYALGECREAALAEQQEQAEPDSPERRCGGPGCDMKCCQPVQEPAAIVGTQEDVWKGQGGQWAPPGPPIKTVHMLRELPVGELLYTAPPQRKPLTKEEILSVLRLAPPEPSLWPHLKDEAVVGDVQKAVLAIARAIERAHGIGGEG